MKHAGDEFSLATKLVHWGSALVIFALLAVGLIMEDMPQGQEKLQLIGLHKSFGGGGTDPDSDPYSGADFQPGSPFGRYTACGCGQGQSGAGHSLPADADYAGQWHSDESERGLSGGAVRP